MNRDELKAIEKAAIDLNNAYCQVKERKNSLAMEQRRYDTACEEANEARSALLKLMCVGPNLPMRSIRIPDTLASIVLTYGQNGVTVNLSHPDGAERL